MLRVGIPVIGSTSWVGGLIYVQNLLRAVRAYHKDVVFCLIIEPKTVGVAPNQAEMLTEGLFDEVIFVGFNPQISGIRQKVVYLSKWEDIVGYCDCVFPWQDPPIQKIPAIYWFPDFQHLHLPEYFSQQDLQYRNQRVSSFAKSLGHIVFSSLDAESDFLRFFPGSTVTRHVLRFHSTMPEMVFQKDVEETLTKYKIAEPYWICSNQFWIHKNHKIVFDAFRMLSQEDSAPLLICTGSASDYRNKNYYEELVSEVKTWNTNERIRLLGLIPREDQIQLIRGATGMIQPSLFEGWSTVLEDCRSLGCPIIHSDLNVHKEQCVPNSKEFCARDANDLVRVIKSVNFPTPGHTREIAGRNHTAQKVREFSDKAYEIFNIVKNSHTPRKEISSNEHSVFDESIVIVSNVSDACLDYRQTILSLKWQGFSKITYYVVVTDGGFERNTIESGFECVILKSKDIRKSIFELVKKHPQALFVFLEPGQILLPFSLSWIACLSSSVETFDAIIAKSVSLDKSYMVNQSNSFLRRGENDIRFFQANYLEKVLGSSLKSNVELPRCCEVEAVVVGNLLPISRDWTEVFVYIPWNQLKLSDYILYDLKLIEIPNYLYRPDFWSTLDDNLMVLLNSLQKFLDTLLIDKRLKSCKYIANTFRIWKKFGLVIEAKVSRLRETEEIVDTLLSAIKMAEQFAVTGKFYEARELYDRVLPFLKEFPQESQKCSLFYKSQNEYVKANQCTQQLVNYDIE